MDDYTRSDEIEAMRINKTFRESELDSNYVISRSVCWNGRAYKDEKR
jgi:hypothetical protein